MNKFDSIIFDLDGTLWDTVDVCVKTLAETKANHEDILYDITAEKVKSCMGLSVEDISKSYYGYLDEEKAKEYTNESLYNNAKNLLKYGGNLYPNVENIIKKLAENYKLYIVSNCIDGYIEAFLNSTKLKSYFADFESNGKTKLNKGDNIKLIIKRNNIKSAVYVGDTIGDMNSAKYANIPFVYASYGFGDVKEYDYNLEQPSDLLTIFN